MRALTVVGSLLAIAASCSPFGVAEMRAGTETTSDAGAPEAAVSADGAPPDPSCPDTGRGPTMVRVGNVCIDSTPVTNGQYRAFLEAQERPFSGTPCGQSAPTDIREPSRFTCRHLDKGRPEIFDDPMMPAVCVTICDARGFCEWAGKHLCAGLDGKPQEDFADIGHDRDEWTHVCTENGAHSYSTGDVWKPSGCIVREGELVSPQPVDREERCEGPPGVFDLIGNVVVWIDACAKDECRCAGESSLWRSTESVELGNRNQPGRCDAIDTTPPADRATDIGFRCCATPK